MAVLVDIPAAGVIEAEWRWPTSRSTVTHAYVKGPGAFDAAVCGAIAHADHTESVFENDPRCTRCLRAVVDDELELAAAS